MKKNLSEYLNLNGQDINVSLTYETGENNVHPHFNIFIQWEGMEYIQIDYVILKSQVFLIT